MSQAAFGSSTESFSMSTAFAASQPPAVHGTATGAVGQRYEPTRDDGRPVHVVLVAVQLPIRRASADDRDGSRAVIDVRFIAGCGAASRGDRLTVTASSRGALRSLR